jgi:hypothetical protein
MADSNPDAILNTVLSFLTDLPNADGKLVSEISAVLTIPLKDSFEIIRKLERDGFAIRDYITDPVNASPYWSTFEGRMFIENGGYVRQKQIDNEKMGISVRNENRRLRNDHLLIAGTWFAGIAALLLLLWQVFLYLYPVHRDYPLFFWQK